MTRYAFPIVLALLVVGCQPEGGPTTQSECQVSPDTLAFGRVITPQFGWESDYRTISFTITSTGDSALSGTVTVRAEPAGPHAAMFHISPADTDPEFSVPPGESVTFTLGVTMENASFGNYSGEVDLGSGCGAIPITLEAFPSQ